MYKSLLKRTQNYNKYVVNNQNVIDKPTSFEMTPRSKFENERKVRSIRISDYFKGKFSNIRCSSIKA